MYRGQIGQWAWVLHRVSGVAVAFFLFVHILDTALVGFGPNVYNVVVGIYERPSVRVLEVLLVAAVLYHGGNGVRLIAIDFIPSAIKFNRAMIYAGAVLFPVIMIPVAYLMLRQVF
ncbi:MAG TPA: succinate dehydrogenase, cytochrome b556 subunit [Chloroflexota bacterium]|nr:succinate dehydrogenase, cytochrome b556 subunit [Chloroflexota bacterium]